MEPSFCCTWNRRNRIWSGDSFWGISGRKTRILTMPDEYNQIWLVVECAQRIGAIEVIARSANAMIMNGSQDHNLRATSAELLVALRSHPL